MMNHRTAVELIKLLQCRHQCLVQARYLYSMGHQYEKSPTDFNERKKYYVPNKLPTRGFSTSSHIFALTNKKRNPIQLRPKALKSANVVFIRKNMTVAELADLLKKDEDDIFELLMLVDGGDRYEYMDSVIKDIQVIMNVVKKSGMRFTMDQAIKQKPEKPNKEEFIRQSPPTPEVLKRRSPVVTIMGHVDHGKTTLLDFLRKSKIVDKEFGGITQHIGAFSVALESGDKITFLDTPGHAAFSAMRARGAEVTDIIVLVVAADDGVMHQTVESINHAKNSGVPIIVAVNKIDRSNADIERTKQMLLEQDLVPEEFGGDVQVVPISALKGTNIKQLKEAIITLTEVLDLKGDSVGKVEGRIIESRKDPGRGKLATAIIQRGTLKKGSILIADKTWAKVRSMTDDNGKPLRVAPPSTAIEITGWKEIPSAGDEILEVDSEKIAREIVDYRSDISMEEKIEKDQIKIDEKRLEHHKKYVEIRTKALAMGRRRFKQKKEKETVDAYDGPELSIVIKGDVDGSLEAILDVIDSYKSTKCRLSVLNFGIGDITQSDIELAQEFNGVVYGFNVKVSNEIKTLAKSLTVPIYSHQVIYKLFDDLYAKLSSKLPVEEDEEAIGEAKVLKAFEVGVGKRKVSVAGCLCTRGVMERKKRFKVTREGEVIYSGDATSLRHLKNEVDKVKADVECGISLNDKDIQFLEGDIIKCFNVKSVKPTIDWNPGF